MDLQLASQVVTRARSIADLPNAAHVSHLDEIHSLNEAWKDIYAALKDSDDDYYLNETTLTVSSVYAVAGSTNEYLIPLPDDFAQIRYLDYQGSGNTWWPVKKFPLSMKDYNPSEPYYRLKGNYLWLIGGNIGSTSGTLRLGYYPPPAVITLPQAPYYFGTSYSPTNMALVSAPGFSAATRAVVYALNGTGLKSESINLGTVTSPVALFTESGAASNLVYYKGTLYWIRGGNIYSKATDLTAAFTAPTGVITSTAVTSFFIASNTIYYTNATEIRSCTLAGASDALVTTVAATSVALAGGVVYYTTSAGALVAVSPSATLFASGISKVTSDGTELYVLDTSYQVRKLTLDDGAVSVDTVLQTDAGSMGQAVYDDSGLDTNPGALSQQHVGTWVLPVLLREQQRFIVIDTATDYDFAYPNNLVPEIMSVRCAVDFRAKGQKDTAELKARMGELWERFRSSIKRDEYRVTRIRNAYDSSYAWGLR